MSSFIHHPYSTRLKYGSDDPMGTIIYAGCLSCSAQGVKSQAGQLDWIFHRGLTPNGRMVAPRDHISNLALFRLPFWSYVHDICFRFCTPVQSGRYTSHVLPKCS